jgi:hypothetical protein
VLAAVIVSISSSAPAAPSAGAVPSGAAVTSRSPGDRVAPGYPVAPEHFVQNALIKSAPSGRACVPRLRRAIADRRAATWHWQAELGLALDRTARRARSATNCAYLGWMKRTWALRAHAVWRVWGRLQWDVRAAICFVFRGYCAQALAVSWCESKHDITAGVGKHQYLGIFQMGDSERQLYGHDWTALGQARAAWRYFDASGRDWSPWSCKP